MTKEKEKAKKLVDKYYNLMPRLGNFKKNWEQAKQRAIICVEEIISSTSIINWRNEEEIDFTNYFDFWKQVLEEIKTKIISIFVFMEIIITDTDEIEPITIKL